MSEADVERLFQACRTNVRFRAKVRGARRAYVEKRGFALTAQEWEVFDAIDWDLADEELLTQYARPMRVT